MIDSHDQDPIDWRARREDEQRQQRPQQITRVIDLRALLPWALSISVGIAWAITGMYFSVQQLIRDVGEIKIATKEKNAQDTSVASEVALLRFRVAKLENDRGESKARTKD